MKIDFGLKRILWLAVIALAMVNLCSVPVWADTEIKATISDPDNPGRNTEGSGNTVNTVLSTPTVSRGENRVLGTIRISGKPGIAVPVKPGQKVMLTLPLGTSYMQTPRPDNYRMYVEWPELIDGEQNQICDNDGQAGMEFIAATPHSLILEVGNIDSNAKVMALDFVFSHEELSMVRIAPFVEIAAEYSQDTQGQIKRIEFFRLLSGITLPFADSVIKSKPAQEYSVKDFKDTINLDPADLDDIEALVKDGFIRGDGQGCLRPDDYITRAEAACLLGNVFVTTGCRAMFIDSIPPWAEPGINSAYAGGIIYGYPDGSFRPYNFITRSEAISLLQRCFESYSKKSDL